MVILQQDYYEKGKFEKILFQHGWERVSNWECLFVHREKGLFLSVYVDAIFLAGKKQHIDPVWKLLQTRRLNNSTKYLLDASMTITLEKKK